MYRGQEVLIHLFDDDHTTSIISGEDYSSSGNWGSWVPGKILGYRGYGWEEVEVSSHVNSFLACNTGC